MKTLTKELETALGKSVEEWNVSDLQPLSLEENSNLLDMLKDPPTITECLQRSKDNKEVADILYPLSIKILIDSAEGIGNEILMQYQDKKLTSKDLQAECEKLISKDSVYMKLVAYLIIIATIPDADMTKYEEDIKRCFLEIKNTVCAFAKSDMASVFTLIDDLLELIFPLRSRYFDKYQKDLLNDSDGALQHVLDMRSSVMQKLVDEVTKTEKGGEKKDE